MTEEITMFDEPDKEDLKENQSSLDNECAFFLTIYCEWSHDIAKINKMIKEGADEKELNANKFRHIKLERRMDVEWNKLTDDQREWLFYELINKGEIPEKAGDILKMFKGKVVKLNA